MPLDVERAFGGLVERRPGSRTTLKGTMPASTVRPGKASRKYPSLPMPFWKLTTIASGLQSPARISGRLGGVARLDRHQDQVGVGDGLRIGPVVDILRRTGKIGAEIVGEAQAVRPRFPGQPFAADEADGRARRRKPAADIAADAAGAEDARSGTSRSSRRSGAVALLQMIREMVRH